MPTHRVAILVGSLRKGSFNRKLALAMKAMAPASLALEIVEIGQLPLFNQDDEASPPPASAAVDRRPAPGRAAPRSRRLSTNHLADAARNPLWWKRNAQAPSRRL